MSKLISSLRKKVKIGLVAKYVGSNDPYISVILAARAGGFANRVAVDIVIIDAEALEHSGFNGKSKGWDLLRSVDGIIVPGGFDKRGVEGKILAVKWARMKKVPYLGLCLGMQLMLVEFARNVLKMRGANSTEFNPKTHYPIISLLKEQKNVKMKGASMRLGAYPCKIKKNSLAYGAYHKFLVDERHRHRYEFNNKYKNKFEKKGIVFSGIYVKENLVEIAELKDHPFMIGTQFHPEFKSRPLSPHPLFVEFIRKTLQ